jgi:hypothetical protein
LVRRPQRKRSLVDLDVDGMVILKWTLKKRDVRVWIGLLWFMIATSDGLL